MDFIVLALGASVVAFVSWLITSLYYEDKCNKLKLLYTANNKPCCEIHKKKFSPKIKGLNKRGLIPKLIKNNKKSKNVL